VISWALAHPLRSEAIAAEGRRCVMSHHAKGRRADQLVKLFSGLRLRKDRQLQGLLANYTVIARSLCRQGVHYQPVLYELMRLLQKILEEGESLSEENAWHAVYTCLSFDRIFGGSLGEQVLFQLTESFSGYSLPWVAQAWMCLNRGQEAEAKKRLAGIAVTLAGEVDFQAIFHNVNRVILGMLTDRPHEMITAVSS